MRRRGGSAARGDCLRVTRSSPGRRRRTIAIPECDRRSAATGAIPLAT
jgi:hypothetical protein